MHVTVADVLRHRDAISPREAATLTLAVGAAWDRQKALRGDVGLPDAATIALHDTGDVTFLLTPSAAGSGVGSLSALLARLLGVNEPEAPRQPIPGGLLITIAGQLGQMELPSRNEEGFRAALVRFADDRPDALANVFWRVAGARPVTAERGRLPMPDRRRQPRVVSELRRELRDAERRAFEARAAAMPVPARLPARRRRAAAAVAVGCAALLTLVAALGTRPAVSSSAAPAAPGPSVVLPAPVADPAPDASPAANPSANPAAEPADPASTGETPGLVAVRRSTPGVARVRAPQRSGTRPRPVAFPGGTRTILWLPADR